MLACFAIFCSFVVIMVGMCFYRVEDRAMTNSLLVAIFFALIGILGVLVEKLT